MIVLSVISHYTFTELISVSFQTKHYKNTYKETFSIKSTNKKLTYF